MHSVCACLTVAREEQIMNLRESNLRKIRGREWTEIM